MSCAARIGAGLALLIVVACAAPTGPDRPLLRVGTSGDYRPFSYGGTGFDLEVARRLAADWDYGLEWVPFAWPELAERVAAGDFDVVMSGVTWLPERAVVGRMSRAVASGGPCVLGSPDPARVGVNRGGALERWAREHYAAAAIRAVDDNASLGERLAAGEFDAVVTDRFELPSFRRSVPDAPFRCGPAADRKVYWVSPARAADLGPALDAWIAAREVALQRLRVQWFGTPAPRSELDHLIDLLARRLALMPAVARYKSEGGHPLADPVREEVVVDAARSSATERGLDPASVEPLFRTLIELALAVQRRSGDGPAALDLDTELRPLLLALGTRLTDSLAKLAPLDDVALADADWAPVDAWLSPSERERLLSALRAVRPAR